MYDIGSREYEMSKIREEKSDKSCKEHVTRLPLPVNYCICANFQNLLNRSSGMLSFTLLGTPPALARPSC